MAVEAAAAAADGTNGERDGVEVITGDGLVDKDGSGEKGTDAEAMEPTDAEAEHPRGQSSPANNRSSRPWERTATTPSNTCTRVCVGAHVEGVDVTVT